MLASRRWRDWHPPENFGERPEHEPTKPPKTILSVLSVPTLVACEDSPKSNHLSSTIYPANRARKVTSGPFTSSMQSKLRPCPLV